MTKIAAAPLPKQTKSHVIGGQEPPTLESIIGECTQTKASWGLPQNDIAFALAFWTMTDCGFRCISSESILPRNWKHETRQMYEAEFVLPPHSAHPVKLVALPVGEILCLNVFASEKNLGLKTLAIHSPGYVPRPEENSVSSKISGLHDFQFLLREVLIWPIRCAILTEQGIMNGSLCGVSDEIKLRIVQCLPITDVLMLSETCHDLNRICNDQGLWKTLFHENFKGSCKCARESEGCDDTTDWKEAFKEVYAGQKTSERTQNSPADSYHTTPEMPYGSEIDFEIDY